MSAFHPLRTLTVGLLSATSGLTTPNLERHTARKPNLYNKGHLVIAHKPIVRNALLLLSQSLTRVLVLALRILWQAGSF